MNTNFIRNISRKLSRSLQIVQKKRNTHTIGVANNRRSKLKFLAFASAIGASVFYITQRKDAKAASKSSSYEIGLGARQQHEIPKKALDDLTAKFNQYASGAGSEGKKLMTIADFAKAISDGSSAESLQIQTLFKLANQSKSGALSLEEFVNFEILMTGPEADYRIAFELFDTDRNGAINIEEFKQVVATTDQTFKGFDFGCDWVKSFFGHDYGKSLNYEEFTQVLKGLEGEVLRQAYSKYASVKDHTISQEEFNDIFLNNFSQRVLAELPPKVLENLRKIADERVSYSQFVAFYNVIKSLDRVEQAIVKTTDQKQHPQITKKELLRVARRMHLLEFTPTEVDFVFRIFDSDKDGLISLADFKTIVKPVATVAEVKKEQRTTSQVAIDSIIHFGIGSIAGAIGAFAVYPIDLVKTRMQNQRNTGTRLYNNSFDCFNKVLKGEGIRGLYKGLIPQLIGVAPEKAIKLTVNDLLRSLFGQPGGQIYFPLEVLAGAGAGASQVIFTNPIEIVKIRLQTQGEAAKYGVKPKSSITIVKELGFRGLYKGAPACLLRDIPFSGIYFPAYASCKQALTDPAKGAPTPGALLLAGALAGIPAASLVTPADVIKTRLQVEARTGQMTYKNIPDAAVKIWQTEGFSAFWKGAPARVFRSSPQFGVTLLSYEMLHRALVPEMDNPRPPTNAPVSQVDYYSMIGGGAGRSLRRVEQRWGLFGKHKIQSDNALDTVRGKKKKDDKE